MPEIINLNRFRKQAARQQDKARAEANRAAFGRTKAEKSAALQEKVSAIRKLDGHKLTPDDEA